MLFLEDTQATIVSLGRDCQQAEFWRVGRGRGWLVEDGTEMGLRWRGLEGTGGHGGHHLAGGGRLCVLCKLSTLPRRVATEEFPELFMCWAGHAR